MNYNLHEANIRYDKEFTLKNSEDEKIHIDGFSKKLFDKKQKEASQQAQKTKDYSLEYHVVGSTFFKEAKEDDDDILEIEGKEYKICDGKASFTKGYLYVGNNEFVRVKSRIPFIIWFLLLGLLILGICFGLRSCSKQPGKDKPDGPGQEGTPGIDIPIDGTNDGDTVPNQVPHITGAEEFIEVTVYPEVVVDQTTPNIPLYNSENNTVYFQFHIYENDTLLHETGLIPPGYRVQWNAKEALSIGKHDLKFVIDCYDVETKAPCDGATTHCVVTVE